MSRRIIAHLDMDAFYASVELLRYPELKGLPVVIGGRRLRPPTRRTDGTLVFEQLRNYVGRGVVTTATYEARALGVHSAMGMMKAAALAPHAYVLPADFDEYRRQSRRFKAAVAELAPKIEDRGIDEIYIDFSAIPEAQETTANDSLFGAKRLARRIQARVREATGLSCSLGVTPNKLLSKLCSDLDKPGGITAVDFDDIPRVIWPLPAARINGVGPKAARRLRALGIHTIGELAAADEAFLVRHFGSRFGSWLHNAAHGRDDRPLETRRQPKSVSRETTFERDMHVRLDRDVLGQTFTRLCERVADDLARKRLAGRTIGLKLRFDDFRTVTRDITLPHLTADARTIRYAAGLCLKRVELVRRIRLLGVRVSTLEAVDATWSNDGKEIWGRGESLPLFDLHSEMAD